MAAERALPTTFRQIACACGTIVTLATTIAPAGAVVDCADEAQTLSKIEAELPRLEFASPADRPPYCITLETVMAFAGKVKLHVAHCPDSDFAATAAGWTKKQTDYSKLFSRYRCKRTMGQLKEPVRKLNAR
jgi:hypothetical protein